MSFIINRWVRGDDFVGRAELLATLRARKFKPTWVLGNRRVGKTSLLRQIEWLSRNDQWNGGPALYWDLQGAGSPDGLKDSLLEALEDAEDVSDDLGLDIDELEDCSFSELVNKFRRKAKSCDHFTLLIDECEELVDVTTKDPAVLSAFRKLSHTPSFSMIIAGSMRMMDVDESNSRTSPFLPDFLPPQLLGPLSHEETIALLSVNDILGEPAERIFNLSFGNPHLTQVIAEHFSRLGDLDAAVDALLHNQVFQYFFKSNFLCLPEHMRGWWESGNAVAHLAAMNSRDAHFPYVVQSALLREVDGGVQVSPLLQLVESPALEAKVLDSVTPVVTSQTVVAVVGDEPGVPANASPARDHFSNEAASLIQMVFKRAEPVLPLFESHCPTLDLLERGPLPEGPPAGRNHDRESVHRILDGAGPEFVLGRRADERALVYLAGLLLYRRTTGEGHFRDLLDPRERMAAIADRDVVINPKWVRQKKLSPKLAMILIRCLRANPDHRYAGLKPLLADLQAL